MGTISDTCPGSCMFDIQLRQTLYSGYFLLSFLMHVKKKNVSAFVKKDCVSPSVRKQGTHGCVTGPDDMTLAVKLQ